jgi:hypothetical protein
VPQRIGVVDDPGGMPTSFDVVVNTTCHMPTIDEDLLGSMAPRRLAAAWPGRLWNDGMRGREASTPCGLMVKHSASARVATVNSLTVTPDGSRLVYTQNPKDEINLSLIQFR